VMPQQYQKLCHLTIIPNNTFKKYFNVIHVLVTALAKKGQRKSFK